jgi:hypothetical protein
MLNMFKVRDLYETRLNEGGNGRIKFVNEIRHMLGLCDANGNDYKDRAGNRTLKEQQVRPEDFSLQELAEGICGRSWKAIFDPAQGELFSKMTLARSLVEQVEPGDRRALLENTGFGIDPSAFLNINAYTILTGGLIEVKILEAFQNPAFIGDKLMPAEATKLNGQKVIGINPIGDVSQRRAPGEPHPRTQFGERWIQTPETRENALAIDILKEAVFFDLTGDILRNAAALGEQLAYRKELEILDTIIGANNPFNWKGTAYNTYANNLGYDNALTGNDLQDWTNIQAAWLKFSRFTDPDTAKRILINPNVVLVSPGKLATANLILNATMTQRRTGAGATTPQTTSNPLNVSDTNSNPYSGMFDVLTSPLLEQQLYAQLGSYDTATSTWFMMEKGKSFKYMQNYPLQVQQASAQSYNMLDRGIVSTYFAHERGIASVWSPWHTMKCSA